MRLTRSLRFSLRAFGRAPLRTLLSASAMTIGVVAVVLLLGVGAGAEREFQEALRGIGRNLLAVAAERRESTALRGSGGRFETLTLEDARAIDERLDSTVRVAPIAMGSFELRHGGRSVRSTVIGTTPAFQQTNNQIVAAGRFLDELDVEDRERVAVIGAQIVQDLFLGAPPLGERLLIDNLPFIVVGVLQAKGADVTGTSEDDRVLIPVSTAQRRLLDVDYVDRIFVQATSKETLPVAQEEIRVLLRVRHGLDDPADADDFTVRDQAKILEVMRTTDRSLSRMLAGLAALTLGLGSLGLLAVTLLSVRERRGEIGLRLAVGALPRHVLTQFLVDALLVALLGALGGLLLGGAGIILGERLIGWRLALTWQAVVYPFAICMALSLLSGGYPALRAARLDPIVALRSD
jgi:putative ABC transport system permease protein